MNTILSQASRRSQAQIRYLTPVAPDAAEGLVAWVYMQAKRDFGLLAPPLTLHSPAPDLLAASWLMLRETLLADGPAGRAAKETVAAAVSLGNACPYCVEVHSATLYGLDRGRAAGALAGDRIESIRDAELRRIAEWARSTGTRDLAERGEPPFPLEQEPELVGVAVAFHYLNRMVTVFLPPSPLPPSLPTMARGMMLRIVGRVVRPVASRPRVPGDSLGLLPRAPLPEDLSWAAGSQHIADAYARAAQAIDAAAAAAVPAAVRELVEAELARWDGRPPGISRAWADDSVAPLAEAVRPAGRLALLTALAPYQVGPGTIDELRQVGTGDKALVAITSWASMAAARRIGSWIRLGPRAPLQVHSRP